MKFIHFLSALLLFAVASVAVQAQEEAVYPIKINAGGRQLTAVLEDNSTTRAFLTKLPVTLPMINRYGREMVYRYGAGTLPTDRLRSDAYQVGDIVYWPPRGSLVILYAQNGERFERQQIGRINESVEFFKDTGDSQVTFERVE